MIRTTIFNVTFMIILLSGAAARLYGQATFSVGSSSLEAADIGAAELTGSITLSVISGTTVASPLSIRYSANITNNAASEISVTGTGGLAGIAAVPTLDSSANTLLINVPAGGNVADRITIQGVRVALASQNLTKVTALVTATSANGNALSAGQGEALVISKVINPFVVDLTGATALAYTNGTVINPNSTVVINEGFATAFTSAVGTFGQTVPTRLSLSAFPSIPAGVKLTFAATATDTTTGATLTTTSGAAETVPRADGTTDVVYAFSSAASSPVTRESFSITVTLSIQPPADTGTITFQTKLVPIGIAKPNAEFPSTSIPRFSERLVPDETELTSGNVELAFPFQAKADNSYTGIAITNPENFRVNVTITAHDTNGSIVTGANITNPVTVTLPRKGQLGSLATEIFGSGFNASTGGTIRATGKTSLLAGFYLQGAVDGTRLDGATAEVSSIRRWTLPAVSRQGSTASTRLEFFNPGTGAATATLNLHDSQGKIVATSSQAIAAQGAAVRNLTEIFTGINLGSFTGGYVTGQSDLPLVVRETFGNHLDSNVLNAQVGFRGSKIDVAHFACGGGFTTELNLVNLDDLYSAVLTLTAFAENGSSLSGGNNPVKLTLAPGEQVIRTVEDLFQISTSSLTTGYIRIDIGTFNIGPFISAPLIAGSVRFSAPDGAMSAALPLVLPGARDFVYSHIAQNNDFYTGVAVLNTNSIAVPVTIEAFRKDGILIGSSSKTLQPGQKIADLISEFVPTVSNQVGGYIRVRADQPITSFSLFGDTKGLSLSAISPQRIK